MTSTSNGSIPVGKMSIKAMPPFTATRRWKKAALAALLVLGFAGCQDPPKSVIEAAATDASGKIEEHSAGKNQVGEACHYQAMGDTLGPAFAKGFDVFCGSWQQPSGHIYQAQTAVAAEGLSAAATSGPWRAELDQRISCGSPVSTSVVGGAPAALLQCSRLNGGWPHLGLVADVGSHTFYVDGVPSALPALETAMAEISGIAVPNAGQKSTAAELISSTIASKPFGSGDLDYYYKLMRLGEDANDAGDYASAEQAYRTALTVQEKVLGRDNIGIVVPLIRLALQVSNQGRFAESKDLFQRARDLVSHQPDPMTKAALDFYLAQDAANRGQVQLATNTAATAEREYRDLVPSLTTAGGSGPSRAGGSYSIADTLFLGPEEQNAVVGIAAVWWFESYLSYKAGQYDVAKSYSARARNLLKAAGLNPPGIVPRTVEISALSEAGAGQYGTAEKQLGLAAHLFQKYQANDRPAAIMLFLAGKSAQEKGDEAGALDFFRQGMALAQQHHLEIPSPLVELYLSTVSGEASQDAAHEQQLALESFEAMQLIQTDQTSQILAKAFARLSAGQSKTRDLLRSMQDADLQLQRLFNQRDAETQKPTTLIDTKKIARIDLQITKLQQSRADSDAAAQAASPEYAQLVQTTAAPADIQKLLHPGEALLAFQVGPNATYAVMIGRDALHAYRVPLGAELLEEKIEALRRTIEPNENAPAMQLPVYDVAGAHALYSALLGPVSGVLDGLKRLVVVPSGPLNGLPLEVLVTDPTPPVKDQDYSRVPFLVNKLALSYIPSSQNFVLLRKSTKPSKATQPYIGFGDFQPATTPQLMSTFPFNRCGSDLISLKALPPLPGSKAEVSFIGQSVFHTPPDNVVLGYDFTKAKLEGTDLSQFKIIELATHALLPTDLRCRKEPTIVVSPDRAAANADAAFLGLSDILSLKLDADLVVLSACNTGRSGDGLSGLARSFFFAGARGLLVTHWALSDVSGLLLTTLTLSPPNPSVGSAEALREAKLMLIHVVSARFGATGKFYTHPFAWAPFVLVGDGVRGAAAS
jgi:CHAT domain-containing protein